MYEFYQLSQAWAKIMAKGMEPAFNNPIADWYMDQCTEAMLKCWFWPGQLVAIEDQFNQFAKLVPLGNICRPQ